MFTKFDRYILEKMLLPLLSAIVIMVFIFWLIQTSGFLEYLVRGVPMSLFWKISVSLLPRILLLVVPISAVFAVLIAYNNLTITNELTIIKNSGFSKIRLLVPILLISTVLVMILYILNLYMIPISIRYFSKIKREASDSHTTSFFRAGEFLRLNQTTIYLDKKNAHGVFSGALFYTIIDDTENTVTARHAQILVGENEQFIFVLSNGIIQRQKLNTDRYIPSEDLFFDRYVLDLDSYKPQQKSNKNASRIVKIKEKTLMELLNPTEEDLQRYRPGQFASAIVEKLTFPLLALILPLMAFALVTYGQFNRLGNNLNVFLAVSCCIIYFAFYYHLLEVIKRTPSSFLILIIYLTVLPLAIYYKMIIKERF